jgi:CheY-like chemotaxis protein
MEKQPCTVLMVDDEPDFRRLVERHFVQDLSYRVYTAGDGVEALERLDERGPEIDIVITDIRMPNMGGQELIKRIRESYGSLPIIGITGHDDLHDRLAMLDSGAYYYLDKPLPSWSVVDRLVDNAVRVYRYEKELEVRRRKESEIARLVSAYIAEPPRGRPKRRRSRKPLAVRVDVAIDSAASGLPSGDFVEWFERIGDEVVFYIADASGHMDLVPCFLACLSSMVIHRSHHRARPTVVDLASCLNEALERLRESGALDTARFMTLFLGSVNQTTGVLTYVNAGHPNALLFRADADAAAGAGPHCLGSTCLPVGLAIGTAFRPEACAVQLHPGDAILVYSDGISDVIEAREADVQECLGAWLEPVANGSASEIIGHLTERLRDGLGPEGFEDDATLLTLKISAP